MAPTKKTKQRVELSFFKVFLYIFLIGFILMIFIGYSVSIRPQELGAPTKKIGRAVAQW